MFSKTTETAKNTTSCDTQQPSFHAADIFQPGAGQREGSQALRSCLKIIHLAVHIVPFVSLGCGRKMKHFALSPFTAFSFATHRLVFCRHDTVSTTWKTQFLGPELWGLGTISFIYLGLLKGFKMFQPLKCCAFWASPFRRASETRLLRRQNQKQRAQSGAQMWIWSHGCRLKASSLTWSTSNNIPFTFWKRLRCRLCGMNIPKGWYQMGFGPHLSMLQTQLPL